MGSAQLLLTVGAHVLLAGIVIRAVSRPTRMQDIEAFASRYGVALTPVAHPIVDRYLHHVRRYRIVGAYVCFVAGVSQVEPLFIHRWSPVGAVTIALAGYLIGAILAEARRPALRTVTQHRARLGVRRVEHYVAPRTALWVRLVPILSLAATAVYLAAPAGHHEPRPAPASGLVLSLMSVVAALGVTRLQREIAERPQPIDEELAAVDTGIRIAAMHAVSGAGVGLLLLLLASHVWWLSYYSMLTPWWMGMAVSGLATVVAARYWLVMMSPARERLSHLTTPRTGGATREPA